jgi:predicted SprT family Zn-dependent metalloprotease
MAHSRRKNRASSTFNLDLFYPDTIRVPAPATLYTKIRAEAERQCEAASRLEAKPDLSRTDLPTEEELYRLFDRYNWTYFRGRLRRPTIQYSDRMTMAGAYLPDQRIIKISRRYHQLFPEEITDTLKHEMIHLVHLKHDSAFRAEAERLGASVKARSHPLLGRPPKYVYECLRCRTEFPRQKRLVMASCGYCSPGGKYDVRFKLVLKNRVNKK